MRRFFTCSGFCFWAIIILVFGFHGYNIANNLKEKEQILKATYTRLYHSIPWPSPIPKPDEVTVFWSSRLGNVLGRCRPALKHIEISHIYQDKRLKDELDDLMTHEIAHFLWLDHPRAFTQFLKSVGVSNYTNAIADSKLYLTVKAGHRPPSHTVKIPCLMGKAVELIKAVFS